MRRPRLASLSRKSRRWPLRRVAALAALVLVLALSLRAMGQAIGTVYAQQPDGSPTPDASRPRPPTQYRLPVNRQTITSLHRRLVELDRLLTLGSLSRAEALLNSLAQHRELEGELVPYRIRLAQAKGDHDEAVMLCRDALEDNPNSPRYWRDLAVSLIALDRFDEAHEAVDHFVAASPNRRSSVIVAVSLLRAGGGCPLAVSVLDSARLALDEPQLLGRERALCLLELGQPQEAAAELSQELRVMPFNVALVRKCVLEQELSPEVARPFIDALAIAAGEPAAVPGEAILVANLRLQMGDIEGALAEIDRLFATTTGSLALLQNCTILGRELKLEDEAWRQAAQITYLLAVLERLAIDSQLDPSLRPRALTNLARVCEQALSSKALGEDPWAVAERIETLLLLVKREHPQAPQLYAAQIRLAHYSRDVLGEPGRAASRLERLLTDLDLPTEGVALARLTLGECYLAAGDTTRGRLVLTRLGRDPDFQNAAGHAHYHLARLDLAEGHYTTARDRFAVVAMDNPAAPYANDALELGLAVAEELDNPSGGPAILDLYAPCLYYDLTAQPDSQLVALENFVGEAELVLDLETAQHLLERGRFELATLYETAGRGDDALAQLQRIVLDHPDGRFPAAALARRAAIFSRRGEAERARAEYQRLLMQYPDYLFADDVRDRLKNLP